MASKRRDRLSRRPVSSPTRAEREILDLVGELGADSSALGRELSGDERLRTDAVADRALQRILRSPRTVTVRDRGLVARASAWATAVWSSRTLLLAVVVAVVASAVVVTWPTASPPSLEPGQPNLATATPPMSDFSLVSDLEKLGGEPAADELRQLAARAAEGNPIAAGSVHHVRLDGWYFTEKGDAGGLVPTVTDRYFLPDGRIRLRESRGTPLDTFGRVRTSVPVGLERVDETFPGPAAGAGYADWLPTAPEQLRSSLVPDRAECPILAACLVQRIVDLTYTWVPGPALRSALWLILVGEEAVRYLGVSTDRLGREAVAFAVPTADASRRIVIYADRGTGELLGSEEVILRRLPDDGLPADVPAPAVVSFTAVATSERIDEPGVPK